MEVILNYAFIFCPHSLAFLNELQSRHVQSGKPAYRWLGWRGKLKNEFDTASDLNEPKKRVFGSDITNCNSKRSRVDSQVGWKSKSDENEVKQHAKHISQKGIDFGPFAPVSMSKAGDAKDKIVNQIQEWENLASTYRPQYHNQGIKIIICESRWSTFGTCMRNWYSLNTILHGWLA